MSRYGSAWDASPTKALQGTWQQFVECVRTGLARTVPAPKDGSEQAWKEAKESLPGFVCAPFDGRRRNANAGDHTAIVIDVDDVPDQAALFRRLERWQCVAYESPSSRRKAPDALRLRVCVALTEPVPPHAVKAARSAFALELGLDPVTSGVAKANAVSQIMFLGRVDGTPERDCWVFGGEAWTPPAPGDAPLDREVHAEASEPTYGRDVVPDLSALAREVETIGVDGKRRGGLGLMRATGGWLARKGYHPDAIAEAVFEQIPSDQPDVRAEQARACAEQFYDGDPRAAGYTALSEWLGADVAAELEDCVTDPWVRMMVARWPSIRAQKRSANDTARTIDTPVDALPDWVRDHVLAVQHSLRLPLAVHTAYALGALSCAAQGKLKIRVKRSWHEHTNMLMCIVADSGEGKSPAFNAAMGPIQDWEMKKRESERPAFVEARMNRELAEKRKRWIEDDMKKGWKELQDAPPSQELLDLHLELDRPEPVEFRYVVGDATPAATANLLALHGRIAVLSDDADGIFQVLAGKHNNGVADIDLWLHAYNGKFLPVDRIGRTTPEPRHPESTLAAVLSLQPDRFRVHAKNAHFAGQGLTQRIAWVKAGATGVRYDEDEDEPEIPEAIEATYAAGLLRMLEQSPRELTLSADAHAERKRWRQELDRRSRGDKADVSDIRGWVSKHQGRTLRIAALLHDADGAEGLEVSGDTMRRAIAIGRWLLENARDALRGNTNGALLDDLDDRLLDLVIKGHRKLGKLQAQITPNQRKHVPEALERLVEQRRLVLNASGYSVDADGADGR